jgi:GMP synthase (glutamine-hydrolysing)
MKTIDVFQHVPRETLGALETCFREASLGWRYWELFREVPRSIDWAGAAGLVVLGGPMNVDEVARHPFLRPEVEWIREAVAEGVPVLGVCLGSQLLAKALGARVYASGVKEIGWYEIEIRPEAAADPLFAGSGPRETVFQWHGDTFDLPEGAVHLAASPLCRHQAFRSGRSAWGLQFHVEMTPELVDDWLDDPDGREELAALDYVDPESIRAATPAALPKMQATARRVLASFAAICAERAGTGGRH